MASRAMMQTERFKSKAAALRVKELCEARGERCHIYKGHRHYVLQRWPVEHNEKESQS
jgi:tRNA A58 N-methylase Trm61